MQRIYLDTETCGLHGMPVIAQYAIEDGLIEIFDFWNNPIKDTLKFIEWLCENCIVGFNLAFDWFHINKIYNTFNKYDHDAIPVDHIDDIALVEIEARDGLCVKPKSCLDLMLYARKTDLQITMDRGDVYVRKVPNALAWDLARVLNDKIKLEPILFAGRKKKHVPHFQVRDIKKSDGTFDLQFKNIVLKFRPSVALKAIAEHKLGEKVTTFSQIELDKRWYPKEYGYAPYALAVGKPGKWNKAWPEVITHHITHWRFNSLAKQYALNDVNYTRKLDLFWNKPVPGDNDSILACSVAACRWKGYRIDIPRLEELVKNYKTKLQYPTAPGRVKEYIGDVLSPIERVVIEGSTKKSVLKEIASWKDHPEASKRAQNVLDARQAQKKIELLEKLLHAGRFHASCKVIGALSGRMSGADGLNAQGIDKTKEVRGCFPLAFDSEQLLGGDMQSFEISIAEADYQDPVLREQLLSCEKCRIQVNIDNRGRKVCPKCGGSETMSFHALFAMGFWPDMTYEEIMATKGTPIPIYNYAKNGAFCTIYGGQVKKLMDTLNIQDEDSVQQGLLRFWRTYQVAGKKRRQVEFEFASLYQNKIPGPILYKQPKDYIESLLGFRRYFILENYIIKALYDLAENPPKSWNDLKGKVIRNRGREQTVGNSIRSALYGAAFSTQNSNIRQAANHRIQSTGAGITKAIQCAIWEFQPAGISEWQVRPLNIHDEIQSPTNPQIIDKVENRVYEEVEKYRPIIPLIGIDFGKLNSWADK